jgi:hypothetical protein
VFPLPNKKDTNEKFWIPAVLSAFPRSSCGYLLASGAAEAGSTVPLKATVAITETIQPIGAAPCILIGAISGTGTATHLGKVTLVSQDCINPISETTTFSFFSNQLVLTVANGDQVRAGSAK